MFNILGDQPNPDVLLTVSTRTVGVGERTIISLGI